MEREAPRRSVYENVSTMASLQKQIMQGASFILTHEAALRNSGTDPATDETLIMLKEELSEVREQMRRLRTQMKEDERLANEAAAREYADRRAGGDVAMGHESDGGEWDDE